MEEELYRKLSIMVKKKADVRRLKGADFYLYFTILYSS